jgi:hypothetical protein
MIAWAGVMVLVALACSGVAERQHGMDRHEMQRVKRLSERLRREETWPFD